MRGILQLADWLCDYYCEGRQIDNSMSRYNITKIKKVNYIKLQFSFMKKFKNCITRTKIKMLKYEEKQARKFAHTVCLIILSQSVNLVDPSFLY